MCGKDMPTEGETPGPEDKTLDDTRTASSAKHRRWALALVALPPAIGIATALLAPEPHGHWVEHLSSVGFKSTQLAALAVAAVLLRRSWNTLLLLVLAIVAVGIVLQVAGDWSVARSIWRTTGDPGGGAGYEWGHETSGLGDLIVVIAGLAFPVVLAVTRRARVWVAVVVAVLAIVPPPFLWPAAGLLVVMVYGYVGGGELRPVTRVAPAMRG